MEKQSFWQSEKGKAAVKLGLWMIFIIILVVIVIFSEQNNSLEIDSTSLTEEENNTEVEYEFKSYSQMQQNLLMENYEYEYVITTADSKYVYTGKKANGKEIGFRESSEGIIKYYDDGSGIYQITLDEMIEFETIYSNFNEDYLNLDVLFTNLNEYLYTIEINEDTRLITYDKEGYQVKVLTDTENITEIYITVDTVVYELKFSKVGECEIADLT